MPIKKLTQAAVDGFSSPEEGRVDYYDRDLKGFMLRITENGAKTWSVTYRINGDETRKNRRITLGPLARIPKVAVARDKARRILDLAEAGKDPAAIINAEE